MKGEKTVMGRKRRWFYLLIAVVLAGLVLGVYNEFNGNPLSKRLARDELQQYMQETYPEQEMRIANSYYDFKFKRYGFKVKLIGDNRYGGDPDVREYVFEMQGWLRPEVASDGIYTSLLDEETMERLGKEAAAALLADLRQAVPELKRVDAITEVLQGKIAADTPWSKELPLEKPLQLHFVLDATHLDKQEVLAAAVRMKQLLEQLGYPYRYAMINGNSFGSDGSGAAAGATDRGEEKDAGAGEEAVKEAEYGRVRYVVSWEAGGRAPVLGDIKQFD